MVAIKTLACLLLTGVANAQLPWIPINIPIPRPAPVPAPVPAPATPVVCPPQTTCPACPPAAINPGTIAAAQTACNNAFPNTIPVFREDGSPYGCAPAICGQPGVNIMC
ncbi:hypothetical protein EYZ11_013188 [Aspergillus tanneri]|uniref:Uncharacterized protein n=1 Tax=Aspergillus tanneri TaxID=1220188 RepID=A0A4S3IYJ7_9EURO|nr:hypothetical protein EYZ11_013188 [Aspergillus tanneri]